MCLIGKRNRIARDKRGNLTAKHYDLGYWRKHPNLHGFIVATFADGEDDCRPIPPSLVDLRLVLDAIRGRALPPTTGFFFGTSDGSEKRVAEDIAIIGAALAWLEIDEPGIWRSVVYQASS